MISTAVLACKVAFRPEAVHVKNILKLKYITLQQDDGLFYCLYVLKMLNAKEIKLDTVGIFNMCYPTNLINKESMQSISNHGRSVIFRVS